MLRIPTVCRVQDTPLPLEYPWTVPWPWTDLDRSDRDCAQNQGILYHNRVSVRSLTTHNAFLFLSSTLIVRFAVVLDSAFYILRTTISILQEESDLVAGHLVVDDNAQSEVVWDITSSPCSSYRIAHISSFAVPLEREFFSILTILHVFALCKLILLVVQRSDLNGGHADAFIEHALQQHFGTFKVGACKRTHGCTIVRSCVGTHAAIQETSQQ